MPSSISAALATPSWSTKIASLIIGTSTRLTAKPGEFLTLIALLPMRRMKSAAAACVASLVRRPRISSTSAMTGTGLKKCMPMSRSGCDMPAASAVIEIDEVFVASTA